MKRIVVVLALGGLVSACSGNKTAPTPPPASIASQGTLIVQTCTQVSSSLANCFSYTGSLKNSGTGCASNLRGVTKTFVAGTQTQIGSSEWTYSNTVRANEEVAYIGFNLAVPLPLTGGWVYTTTPSWDNVKCP